MGQRVEPQAGDEQFGNLQRPEVTAAHMCHLMGERGALLHIVIVGLEPGRQQHDRAHQAGDQRAGRDEARCDHRQALQANLPGHVLRRTLKVWRHGDGFALHSLHEFMLTPQAEAEKDKCPACPQDEETRQQQGKGHVCQRLR